MFEVPNTGLKPQVLPKQHIHAQQELIARVFGNQSALREKCGPESDAAHYSIPFGIVTPIEMAIDECHTQLIARKLEMLGSRNIPILEIKLHIRCIRIET